MCCVIRPARVLVCDFTYLWISVALNFADDYAIDSGHFY